MEHLESESLALKDHIIWVDGDQVFCAGEDLKGHPGIYLNLQKKKAVCPYCSRVFQQSVP